MALYLQAVTLLESMVTDPWKEGYCILTPSLANIPLLLSSFVRSLDNKQARWSLKSVGRSEEYYFEHYMIILLIKRR